jgi:hypothetical protein
MRVTGDQGGSTVVTADRHCVRLPHSITTIMSVRGRAIRRLRVSLAVRPVMEDHTLPEGQTPCLATAGGPVMREPSPCRMAPRHAHV